MDTLDKTAWEILNATADDRENLEQIYLQICYELSPDEQARTDETALCYRPLKCAPLLNEVADRVRELVERGLLSAVREEDGRSWQDRSDACYVWRAWFSMTPCGKIAWEASAHFAEQE
jgi:hypothetical protein